MNTRPPKPPNPVPEEDLNLHENFAPVIAENGLIRQPKAPEINEESLPAFLTRLDTLQDLVELRQAEQEEQQKQQIENLSAEQTLTPAENATAPLVSGVGGGSKSSSTLKDVRRAEEGETIPQAAATALIVRAAQTTALAPTSKLTLARRITLLKRKRQHARRLAKRARKRAAQAATTAVPPKSTAPKSAQTQMPKRPNRWKWALALLLLLFLAGISFVPVEKIPLLRNLAYAMGFTKDDTAQMSFLRTLLTWTDKTVGLPGNWAVPSENASLLARADGVAGGVPGAERDDGSVLLGFNALSRAGGQTSLIDMQALNALQRQNGYMLDGVRGAVKLNPGQEQADLGPAVVRDDQVNVRTEANRDNGEVFFGSDNSAINRNFKDGYDSSKTLAKIKNPHIADGKPIDWLTNMTKQTLKTDAGIGGINKELNNTQVAWGSGVAEVGDHKAHRDLYHAWITSRMSRYTSNVMLKKGLADSSFLGAEIPTTASNVLSSAGVQVDIAALSDDQTAWNEYLEWEKNCKAELATTGASGRIDKQVEQYNKLFVQFNEQADPNVGFPQDCSPGGIDNGEKYQNFVGKIDRIIGLCNDVSREYNILREKCSMHSFQGTCDATIRKDYAQKWGDFKSHCRAMYRQEEQKWKENWCAQHRADCDAGIQPPPYPQEQWQKDATKYTQTAWNNGKTMEEDVKEKTGGNSDYFSAVVRTKRDENGNVVEIVAGSQENVQNTVYESLGQNKTL